MVHGEQSIVCGEGATGTPVSDTGSDPVLCSLSMRCPSVKVQCVLDHSAQTSRCACY